MRHETRHNEENAECRCMIRSIRLGQYRGSDSLDHFMPPSPWILFPFTRSSGRKVSLLPRGCEGGTMCPSAHDFRPGPNFRPVGSILMKSTATRHSINELYEKNRKFRGPGVDSCFIISTVVSAITPWPLFVRVIGCGDRELGCEEKEMGENRDRSKEWVSHDISMGVNSKLLFVARLSIVHNEALVPQKEPQRR
jgi:hypothetical protein